MRESFSLVIQPLLDENVYTVIWFSDSLSIKRFISGDDVYVSSLKLF